MDLSNKKVLVYDQGLFSEVAVRLARDFGKVYYFVPWAEAFPKSTKALIGSGFENVERIKYFFDYIDKVDLIVFPDTHCGDMVDWLKDKGYPVAGTGEGEVLELDRLYGRNEQKKTGLPVQETEEIIGLDNLHSRLKEEKNRFIKLNTYRGEIESFYHKDYHSSKPLLDQLAVDLGPKAPSMSFVMEERVEGIEPGIDAILYNGAVASPTMVGFEIKGAGYMAKVYDYENVPEPVKLINDNLEPVLKKLKYNFWFSSELIMTKKKEGYLIDPCCRLAAPVTNAVQQELIANYSEIFWAMGHNEILMPKYTAAYGGGAAFYSSWAEGGHWLEVSFNKEYRQWIKFREAAVFDKRYYAVPKATTVCSVIAVGNSVSDVIEQVQERSKDVSAYMLDKGSADFVDLKKALAEAAEYGIKFKM